MRQQENSEDREREGWESGMVTRITEAGNIEVSYRVTWSPDPNQARIAILGIKPGSDAERELRATRQLLKPGTKIEWIPDLSGSMSVPDDPGEIGYMPITNFRIV